MGTFEVQNKLKPECDKWLCPLGYSLHFVTIGGVTYTYDNPDPDYPFPAICVNLDKKVSLVAIPKYGIAKIEITNLCFEHPRIKRFISELRYMTYQVNRMYERKEHILRTLEKELEE